MDIVVTVPKDLWINWILEGDAVGEPDSGEEWGYFTSGGIPEISRGERVYIVAHNRLRGYSPLTRLQRRPLAFGRRGGAVAVTISTPITGFRGWRYRWWEREEEIPFPEWRTTDVPAPGPRSALADAYARLQLIDTMNRLAPLIEAERATERAIQGEPFLPALRES